MEKSQFQPAIQELRDALKLNPKSSRCHSLLGTIYLKQQQLTMARVHLTQALKLDPQEQSALKGMEQLQKLDKKRPPDRKGSAKPSDRKGWLDLFGGK
jgi:Flp pilus assembly protein TadD